MVIKWDKNAGHKLEHINLINFLNMIWVIIYTSDHEDTFANTFNDMTEYFFMKNAPRIIVQWKM